jgi:multidrug efflux pump subunit AcrA (membrane-fusion protein)
LANAGNEADFGSAWLALQCSRIRGVAAGLLLLPSVDSEAHSLSLTWPAGKLEVGDLERLARRALAEGRLVVAPGKVGRADHPARSVVLVVALPLGMAKKPVATAAIALTTTGGNPVVMPQLVAEQLRWGAGWLEALPWARQSRRLGADIARASSCLDLLAAISAQPRLQLMAMTAVNELATRLRCDRVSIGIVAGNGARLQAVSHSASFKRASRLVDAIEHAMDEAIEQRRSVAFPLLPQMERAVTIAHRVLAENAKSSGASVLSVVLAGSRGEAVGVLTFEHHRAEAFSDETLRLAEAVAALLGPQISLQLRANRVIAGRIVDRVAEGYEALGAPRRPTLKLAAVAVVALASALAFAEGEHRVTAKTVLEAELQRTAAAPFDGFIRTAPVRAGDTVRRGELMAALDDRDLVLDRLKWRAEHDKLLQRQREALAKHDRNTLVVLEPQIRQAEAQMALAEEKLTRTHVLAPFDGIVVSGDLSQLLGAPVEKGKTLFEIAPLDSYRLIVQVDERDVGYVAVGQVGTVVLTGRPADRLPISLTKITPVTVAEEGRNTFRIEAHLSEHDLHLRPGMEGVARIDAGRRSLAWIGLHPVLDWLRLAAWKYLP